MLSILIPYQHKLLCYSKIGPSDQEWSFFFFINSTNSEHKKVIKFKHNLNQRLTSSHPSISSLSISHDEPGTMGNWHNPETSFVPFQRNMEVWPCTLKGITSKNCKKGQSKASLCRDLKKRHAGDKTTFAPSARKNIMLAIQVT